MTKRPNRAQNWDTQLNFDFEYAKQALLQDGSVMPVFVIHGADRSLVIGTPFDGDASKDRIATLIRLFAVAEDARAVSFIAEAWVREIDRRAGETEAETRARALSGGRPSEAEDRREIVVVQLTWRGEDGMHTKSRQGEIRRDSRGKAAGLFNVVSTQQDDNEGRFADLVPAYPVPGDLRKLAAALLPDALRGLGLDTMDIEFGGHA